MNGASSRLPPHHGPLQWGMAGGFVLIGVGLLQREELGRLERVGLLVAMLGALAMAAVRAGEGSARENAQRLRKLGLEAFAYLVTASGLAAFYAGFIGRFGGDVPVPGLVAVMALLALPGVGFAVEAARILRARGI